MEGYAVVLEAIEKASASAKRAADGARPIDLAEPLTGIAQGLPGGTAIEAARLLASAWGRDLPTWARNMDEYSNQLRTAVKRYRADEQAAERDLRVITSRGGARPF